MTPPPSKRARATTHSSPTEAVQADGRDVSARGRSTEAADEVQNERGEQAQQSRMIEVQPITEAAQISAGSAGLAQPIPVPASTIPASGAQQDAFVTASQLQDTVNTAVSEAMGKERASMTVSWEEERARILQTIKLQIATVLGPKQHDTNQNTRPTSQSPRTGETPQERPEHSGPGLYGDIDPASTGMDKVEQPRDAGPSEEPQPDGDEEPPPGAGSNKSAHTPPRTSFGMDELRFAWAWEYEADGKRIGLPLDSSIPPVTAKPAEVAEFMLRYLHNHRRVMMVIDVMADAQFWFKNVPKFFNSSKDHWPKHVASLGDLRTECVVAYIIALMGYTMTKGRQCSRCNSDDRVLDRCYTLPAMNTKEGIYLACANYWLEKKPHECSLYTSWRERSPDPDDPRKRHDAEDTGTAAIFTEEPPLKRLEKDDDKAVFGRYSPSASSRWSRST